MITDPNDVPAPASSVTVQDLDQLVKAIADQKILIEEMEAKVTEQNKILASMQGKAVLYLRELQREDYKSPFGTVAISQKWRVNMPATDEDKAALFRWMEEKGIFQKYATVNSNSLNSLYLSEWEAAKNEGRGMEFSMPGIGEPKLFEALSYRKK